MEDTADGKVWENGILPWCYVTCDQSTSNIIPTPPSYKICSWADTFVGTEHSPSWQVLV